MIPMTQADWDTVSPEFSPDEFNEPGEVDRGLVLRAHKARVRAGVPFRIVSDKRDPGTGVEGSAHEDGLAIDVRVLTNEERYWAMMALALVDMPDWVWELVRDGKAGFNRLGLYAPTPWQQNQLGKASGSIHFDNSTTRPQPRIWMTY